MRSALAARLEQFFGVDDGAGEVDHGAARVAGLFLEAAHGIGLAEAEAVHDHAFGAFDDLSVFELAVEVGDLVFEVVELEVSAPCDLEGDAQRLDADWLEEVGHGAVFGGGVDEFAVAVGGDEDGGDGELFLEDAGGFEAVHLGHADVEQGDVGVVLAGELDGSDAVAGRPDDFQAEVGKLGGELASEEGFVLGDEDALGPGELAAWWGDGVCGGDVQGRVLGTSVGCEGGWGWGRLGRFGGVSP